MLMGQAGMPVKKIIINGNKTINKKDITDQLNTKPVSLQERLFFWKKKDFFSPQMLKNDKERLKQYYQRKGFLRVDVSTKVDTMKNNKFVVVTIKINENTPVKISKVNINFADSISDAIKKEINESVKLVPGKRFIDGGVYDAEHEIKRVCKNNGYPFVEVERNISLKDSAAWVTFNIHAGSKAYFGDMSIEGDSLVTYDFVKSKMLFNKDDEYSQDLIQKSQDRLFNTGIFQFVVIRSLKDSVQENKLPLQVLLKELPPWSLKAQVGYGTEDKFRTSAELSKLQFFGGARKITFHVKHSYFYPVGIETRFFQPDFLKKQLDLIIQPFYTIENEPSYNARRLGSDLTFQKRFKDASRINTTFFYENINLTSSNDEELADKPDIYNKSGVNVGGVLNKTNDLFNPKRGYKLSGKVTLMGVEPSSAYHYYKLEAAITKYADLGKDFVLAGKVKSGVIKPIADANKTPIEDRFMSGGANSIRGWGRHQISPKNSDGDPIGGNSLLETGIELRFPIYKIFRGAVFMDAGNIWRPSFNYDFDNVLYSAGAGVRITTPIGPARIDFATPVINSEPQLQLFITVGHAF